MTEIRFRVQNESQYECIEKVFSYVKQAKNESTIDEKVLSDMLGSIVTTEFLPCYREDAWYFGSWVDALNSCEISWRKISRREDGIGVILYNELSCPSGGIEATEEMVKIFGGKICSDKKGKWWQLW